MRAILAPVVAVSALWVGFASAAEFQGLQIAPDCTTPPYDRGIYPTWDDADGDKEDTRQEVLIAESLVPVTIRVSNSGTRAVTSGLWVGNYTGFVTRDPSSLDIDHLVPLGEVHASGGCHWDEARRRAYANDLADARTLIAVSAGANRSKGKQDPASWLPPNRAYWCTYLQDWVAVKRRWELSVDEEEAAAIGKGFEVCGRYRVGDSLEGRH